jgi:hypothetical protein
VIPLFALFEVTVRIDMSAAVENTQPETISPASNARLHRSSLGQIVGCCIVMDEKPRRREVESAGGRSNPQAGGRILGKILRDHEQRHRTDRNQPKWRGLAVRRLMMTSHTVKPRVLVSSNARLFDSFFDAELASRLSQLAVWQRSPARTPTPALRRALCNAEALITTWDSPQFFPEDLADWAPSLRLIAHCGQRSQFSTGLFCLSTALAQVAHYHDHGLFCRTLR